ncbi:hypothetical protein [Nocardia asiatica]
MSEHFDVLTVEQLPPGYDVDTHHTAASGHVEHSATGPGTRNRTE